ENGIRHGMPSDRQRLDLWIDVARSNGSTIIRVSDDGAGIDPGYVPGVGLTNVRSRLAYLFGDRASMEIGPRAKGGTVATLTFPYADAAGR
ncbi:MAG TPA: ATP-binding protein, partial [Candidatus Baltobacteraceae bacterium]|nr:ATP-binding protein [Candidatus Baltobacteraceae bacterium]